MEILHPRCAGLDVHKDVVVAAVRCVQALSDWLESHGCTQVVMEATGVYWKPVWHLLEGNFELVLANAQHVKNVPGRKTDVGDASWLAELLAQDWCAAVSCRQPPFRSCET